MSQRENQQMNSILLLILVKGDQSLAASFARLQEVTAHRITTDRLVVVMYPVQ